VEAVAVVEVAVEVVEEEVVALLHQRAEELLSLGLARPR